MQRNRYFKSTWGTGGEFVIASTIDTSGTAVDGIAPTAGTASVTVAASPAAGDVVNFFVKGMEFSYVVKAGDTTAATLVASIVAYINATNNGAFTASVAGTTSAVFSFAAPIGILWNGALVSITLGSPNVSTFSAASSTNFGTNGVDPVPGGIQKDLKSFVTSAANGALGVYWQDTNLEVLPGATALPANALRKFYYAYKTYDGNTITTTGIVAGTRQYRSAAYSAGQPDIWTEDFTAGTYTTGQMLRVKIIDKTPEQLPFPNWTYEVVCTGTIATDLATIRDLINAETYDPVATATLSGSVLTITGKYNSRQISVGFSLDTFGSSGNGAVDQSAVVITQTQVSQAEVGTTADVTEFEKYFKIGQHVMIYTPEGITPAEMSSILPLTQTGINYGFLVISHSAESLHESAAVQLKSKRYTVVAIASSLLGQLAAF
jgi:hypothetical protein